MANEDPNAQDPSAGGTTPQGTPAPTDDPGVKATDATGPKAAPEGADEEFLKRLGSLDPATLPQDFRQKLEAPFKADHTQKTQQLAEERKRLELERQVAFDAARRVIEATKAPPGPTPEQQRIKELRELAVAGDANALEELVRLQAQELVQPLQTQVALKNAAESARAYSPYVRDGWNEILSTIEANPKLKRLASLGNYEFADTVMIGLGLEREVNDLRPKYAASLKEVESLKAKVAALEKERAAGLPSSTSRAGTTSGAPVAGRPRSSAEMDQDTWIKAGGRPEDFR